MKHTRIDAERQVGRVLDGRFRLDVLLGCGGSAAVYEAQGQRGRRVAIKLLHPHMAKSPTMRERFRREAYAANRVQHPRSVRVLADGETKEGRAYLVFELLRGKSLAQVLGGRFATLPWEEVIAIAGQVLGVLKVAHDAGVVHRDIKPANLFITSDGLLKVLDFGLARIFDQPHTPLLTQQGAVVGSSYYMPPEQAQGRNDAIAPPTDLFALGAVMYRLLVGEPIFPTGSMVERLAASARQQAPTLESKLPKVPEFLSSIVNRALRYDPAERYPSAEAMLRDVQKAHKTLPQFREIEAFLEAEGGAPGESQSGIRGFDRQSLEAEWSKSDGPSGALAITLGQNHTPRT